MEMRVDERRGDQAVCGVDVLAGLGYDGRGNLGDFAIKNGDVLALASIGQVGLAQDQIEHEASLGWARFVVCSKKSVATPRAMAWGCLPKAGWPIGQVILAMS